MHAERLSDRVAAFAGTRVRPPAFWRTRLPDGCRRSRRLPLSCPGHNSADSEIARREGGFCRGFIGPALPRELPFNAPTAFRKEWRRTAVQPLQVQGPTRPGGPRLVREANAEPLPGYLLIER